MITVKTKNELVEMLGTYLCIDTEQTKFEKWLENNTNLQQFVCELNKVWEHLTDIFDDHLKMTHYRDSDYVWDDYFDIIYPKIQQIVDNTDFGGDFSECV